MTMSRFFKTTIPAALFLAASAQVTSADLFKTTQDYVHRCSTAKPDDDCYGGYERALMIFVLGKNSAKLCVPSQDGTANDDATYHAAETVELSHLTAWLRKHPQPARQEYRRGLGNALVAIYGCK